MSTALITIAHGRHAHLARQHREVHRQTVQPEDYIVVAMDDPDVRGAVTTATPRPLVLDIGATSVGLPLAAARNRGASVAIERGADLLVFLDADCMPARGLVAAYRDAVGEPTSPDRLLCGPVSYLPMGIDPDLGPERLGRLAAPHPARPAPRAGTIETGADHALFWSLSFAVTARLWSRIGGFCEQYVGYGAEDTDFARTAKELGVELAFVGGARAFHQFHPTSSPPVQHLDDIVRNANLFRRRWGTFPMLGWLDQFEARGLVARTADGTAYDVVPHPTDEPQNAAEIGSTR